MISEKRAEEKLMELVELFQSHYREKEYKKAKICYDSARTVASFLEMPEEKMMYYFGSRADEIEGLFAEEKIQKVYEECIFIDRSERKAEEKRRREQQAARAFRA